MPKGTVACIYIYKYGERERERERERDYIYIYMYTRTYAPILYIRLSKQNVTEMV